VGVVRSEGVRAVGSVDPEYPAFSGSIITVVLKFCLFLDLKI
jgi:hypothetical protein